MKKSKILLICVALLLLIVIVSFSINIVLMKYNIVTINRVTIDGEKVIISKIAKSQLDEVYYEGLDKEIPVCLSGNINSNIKIDSIVRAEIIESTECNVTYIRCPTYIQGWKVIGTMHNHPGGNCMLSDQDIKTYASDLRRGQTIIGLKCSEGYIFYVLSMFRSEVEEW